MNNKKQFTIKLSVCFAMLICIILMFGAIITTAFVGWNTKNYANDYENTIKLASIAINETIYRAIAMDFRNGKYDISERAIDAMSDFVENVAVSDIATGKIIYNYKKKNETNNDQEVLYSDYNKNNWGISERDIGGYTITIITKNRMSSNDHFENLKKNIYKCISHILVLIIIMSVISGFFMSDMISSSLVKLSKAAKQMAQGKFGMKIPESHFDEINNLIGAYNQMGIQLNELYSSLEQKVKERTEELEETNNKLKETQAMMVHSEKMRSLGELVAGIAHEINNPVNFIHGNIMILQNYADDLFKLIDLYDKNSASLTDTQKTEIQNLKENIDLEFLKGDIKELIRSCIEGTQRTKNIVLDLKNFSRMEEMVLTQFDIPKEIDTTLNILNNKYKNRITVVKNYDAKTPKIEAYGGQLNQVFMNILDNAQDAIEGAGTVTINVGLDDTDSKNVKIEFIDTGSGIPEENLKKVFEPFFTTKTVGKGTGLGMSISYRVIKDHGGNISIDSKVGSGTKFTIILPIEHKKTKIDNNDTEEKIV